MKKIFLFLILTNFNLTLFSGLNSTHWRIITIDIARDGDPKDRAEFEAARQAFLHIKNDSDAELAAKAIENKWKKAFGRDATVGTKNIKRSLLSLIRYPLMTKKDAAQATRDILKRKEIAQLLDEQKLKIVSD